MMPQTLAMSWWRPCVSTTTSRDVAVRYAGGPEASGEGRAPMVLELGQGMIDRGAVIDFLSQYPHEKEVLFAPLTCIEMNGAHNEEKAIILHMKLTGEASPWTW